MLLKARSIEIRSRSFRSLRANVMFERTRRDPQWDKFKGHHKEIALFIDGANFFVSQKVVGLNIDWRKFLSYYGSQGDLLRAFYYTGILPRDDNKLDPLRPVLD